MRKIYINCRPLAHLNDSEQHLGDESARLEFERNDSQCLIEIAGLSATAKQALEQQLQATPAGRLRQSTIEKMIGELFGNVEGVRHVFAEVREEVRRTLEAVTNKKPEEPKKPQAEYVLSEDESMRQELLATGTPLQQNVMGFLDLKPDDTLPPISAMVERISQSNNADLMEDLIKWDALKLLVLNIYSKAKLIKHFSTTRLSSDYVASIAEPFITELAERNLIQPPTA